MHVLTLLQLLAYEILLVTLTANGEVEHCPGENREKVPAVSSMPTAPDIPESLQLNCCSLSTEVRISQNAEE